MRDVPQCNLSLMQSIFNIQQKSDAAHKMRPEPELAHSKPRSTHVPEPVFTLFAFLARQGVHISDLFRRPGNITQIKVSFSTLIGCQLEMTVNSLLFCTYNNSQHKNKQFLYSSTKNPTFDWLTLKSAMIDCFKVIAIHKLWVKA